jgi:hypothetical protein
MEMPITMSEQPIKKNPWRNSLFGPKWEGPRVQGKLSRAGGVCFEFVRGWLETKHQVGRVSDGDVIQHNAEVVAGLIKKGEKP